MADDSEEEERTSLEDEFKWLLEEEVHAVLQQLSQLLKECSRRFNLPISTGLPKLIKPETFVLSSANGADLAKGVVTLVADSICRADLSLKVHRHTSQVLKTYIREDIPWRLQQVQDAGNHLQSALDRVTSKDVDYEFSSGEEVLKLMDEIMCQLKKGRQRLLNPSIPTLHEIYTGRYMKCLNPPLPHDTLVNFHIHGNKLIMCTYYLHVVSAPKTHRPPVPSAADTKNTTLEVGPTKYELTGQHLVTCPVPWLAEVLTFFTVALQMCQELKNKVAVFSTYWEETSS
ncbi:protein rogdi homolog [Amphiura filiformis]|uniref:protein rogdi homolog n=1 Tax=Amphiura filiformis TaxID=82378 RepID=UPI003B20C2BB